MRKSKPTVSLVLTIEYPEIVKIRKKDIKECLERRLTTSNEVGLIADKFKITKVNIRSIDTD